jgi:hypothetical protein
MANKNVARLLSKEMDRKDFLKYGIGVALAVIGVTGFLNTLLRLGSSDASTKVETGYGASSYGR